jgi:hypothetical protein
MGNREKHALSPTAAQEPEQQSRHCIQHNCLTGNEHEGDDGIQDTMLRFESIQPVAQKMQDQEEVRGNKNRVDGQLNGKGA